METVVLQGIQECVAEFQRYPFQFTNEATLQSTMYSFIRARMLETGWLRCKARVYEHRRWEVPENVSILQTEMSHQNQFRLDTGVMDLTGSSRTYTCQSSTVHALIGIELKFEIPKTDGDEFKNIFEGRTGRETESIIS